VSFTQLRAVPPCVRFLSVRFLLVRFLSARFPFISLPFRFASPFIYFQLRLHVYIEHYLQWDPHSFLFGSPARYVAMCSLLLSNKLTLDPLPVAEPCASSPTAAPPTVALTVGKNLAGQPAREPRALAIGRFGLQSDSSTSARTRSASPLSTSFSDFRSARMSPSNMSDDFPSADAARLSAVEQAIERIESQNEATQKMFKDFLNTVNAAPPAVSPLPTNTRRSNSRHSDTPASPAGRKKLSLKPSTASVFGGDRSQGKAFLTSCRTYIRLCPEAFDNEEQQVVWAMSYMKDDRAGRWAACEFDIEVADGQLRFKSWADFEVEFRKEFTPLSEEVDAVNVLEMTAYHQGKKSVNDYLDRFRDLIHDSGYTNPKTIIVKFRRGLDRRISNALAGMTSGRPSDTDPEAWFRLAVQMDQNRAADEAFYAPQRSAAPALTSSRPGLLYAPKPPPIAPSARFAHATPSPGNPIPMDIDATRKGKTPSDTCRHCRVTGHWAKDCHLRFDVRHMDTDELQTLLEDKLAAKDAVPLAEDFLSSSE